MHPDWLSNSFVIADEEGGTALFVDSGADIEPLVRAVERWDAPAAAILRTHSHTHHLAPRHALAPRPHRPRGRAAEAVRARGRRGAGGVDVGRPAGSRRSDAGAF